MLNQGRTFRENVVQGWGLPVRTVVRNPDRTVVFQIIIPVKLLPAVSLAGQFCRTFRKLAVFFFNGLDIIFDIGTNLLSADLIRRHFFQQWIFFDFLIDRVHQFLAGQDQKLDRLLQLRRHDQLLGKF